MDALFLSCKSSVSGLIPSLSLTDDAWRDHYPFLLRVSMMAATYTYTKRNCLKLSPK